MTQLNQKDSIFLNPGECFWGDQSRTVRTILGSCVAITLWHPKLKVGGMCHYLLSFSSLPDSHRSPRYAHGAFNWLMQQVNSVGEEIHGYHGKIFGGGNMFCADSGKISLIGDQNISMAMELMDKYQIPLTSHNTGGNKFRALQFDLSNGDVWVRSRSIKSAGSEKSNVEK